jgi:pimeloyl-ACP methyl ester carboxylesterase
MVKYCTELGIFTSFGARLAATLLTIGLSGCVPTKHAAAASPPAAIDVNALHCRDLMAALTADSPEAAERDFSAPVRSGLPPPQLRLLWHGLEAEHGALASWRVAKRDNPEGTDRFTLELQFANGTMYALVVFEPAGKVVGLFFLNAPQAKPKDTGAADPRVKQIDVTVGPVKLPGSLTLPAEPAAARVAGAVLIAGSGASDRDESVLGAKPFRDLALSLAARGIATLRYDKRTFAHPELFIADPSPTVETETIVDAVAAIGVLRARPEIDPHRLFVIGHSLGALLAPEVASRAGDIAGLVLLAAPGRPVLEVTLEQLRTQGAKASDLAPLEARVHALPQLAATESLLGLPVSYWRDLDKRDEMQIARDLGRPVLLLRGESDQNVFAVDQERWVQALSGKVPLEAATLPGLSHLLVPADAAASSPHVPEDVSSRIAAFITSPPASAAH